MSQLAQPEQLHICTHCAGELVYPTAWERVGTHRWQIELRCPECGELREGEFTKAAVHPFYRLIGAAGADIRQDLIRLSRHNMELEGETFFAALAANAILPEDF